MAEKKRSRAPKRLAAYQAKRNFTTTPEPSGDEAPKRPPKGKGKETGRYFCVQKHLASHLHYDFRLEHEAVLLSWAVPKGPSLNPKDKRLAMQTEDHPLDYGEFEGVIPEGYGAGIVLLWDRGTWEPEPGFEDVDKALAKGELKLRLNGVKLKGGWVVVRTGGRRNGDGRDRDARGGESRTWLLIKHRDEWAGPIDVAEKFPLSVKSFGDFEDILAQDKPDVWESHRPARGGEAGEMLATIIERAAKLKSAGRPARAAGRAKAGGTKAKRPSRPAAGRGVAARGAAARRTKSARPAARRPTKS